MLDPAALAAILLVGRDKTGDDRLDVEYMDGRTPKGTVDYMSGHRPLSELTKNFPPEHQARVAEKVQLLKQEMALAELRKVRQQSQADLAAQLQVHLSTICSTRER